MIVQYFNISNFDSIVINITIVSYLLTHWVSTILIEGGRFYLEYCFVVIYALFTLSNVHFLAGYNPCQRLLLVNYEASHYNDMLHIGLLHLPIHCSVLKSFLLM